MRNNDCIYSEVERRSFAEAVFAHASGVGDDLEVETIMFAVTQGSGVRGQD